MENESILLCSFVGLLLWIFMNHICQRSKERFYVSAYLTEKVCEGTQHELDICLQNKREQAGQGESGLDQEDRDMLLDEHEDQVLEKCFDPAFKQVCDNPSDLHTMTLCKKRDSCENRGALARRTVRKVRRRPSTRHHDIMLSRPGLPHGGGKEEEDCQREVFNDIFMHVCPETDLSI